MAFKKLFADFADKNHSDLWAELNRRIEAAFSESGDGGLIQLHWATDDIDADGVQKAVGVDGSLLPRSPGFTWGGVAGQSDKPIQVGQTFTPKRVVFAVDNAPGVVGFTAGILVNGVVWVSRTFWPAEQNSFTEVLPPGDILQGSLVSAYVVRSGDAASSRCVVTLVGTPVTP